MYADERARRGSFYDYPPLMTERTFFRLVMAFGLVVVLVLGAHVAEGWLTRLHGTTEAHLAGQRRPAPVHVTERVPPRRAHL
jgi:hypothetical protein